MFKSFGFVVFSAGITGIALLVLGAGLLVSSANASTTGRNLKCEMPTAKGSAYFPAGTQFTIKQFRTTWTFNCDGEIGQWWATESSTFPPVVGGNSGVLFQGDAGPVPSVE